VLKLGRGFSLEDLKVRFIEKSGLSFKGVMGGSKRKSCRVDEGNSVVCEMRL
jgi:hypothetical protein